MLVLLFRSLIVCGKSSSFRGEQQPLWTSRELAHVEAQQLATNASFIRLTFNVQDDFKQEMYPSG